MKARFVLVVAGLSDEMEGYDDMCEPVLPSPVGRKRSLNKHMHQKEISKRIRHFWAVSRWAVSKQEYDRYVNAFCPQTGVLPQNESAVHVPRARQQFSASG